MSLFRGDEKTKLEQERRRRAVDERQKAEEASGIVPPLMTSRSSRTCHRHSTVETATSREPLVLPFSREDVR